MKAKPHHHQNKASTAQPAATITATTAKTAEGKDIDDDLARRRGEICLVQTGMRMEAHHLCAIEESRYVLTYAAKPQCYLRILIIEDDLRVADRVSALLTNAGYDVHNAYNCGDAVAADHSRYKMALVDGGMMDRSGRTIYDYIGSSPGFARLPFITINRKGIGSNPYNPMRSKEDESELLRNVSEMLRDGTSTSEILLASVTTADRNGGASSSSRSKNEETVVEVPRRQQLIALKTLSDLGRSISSVLDLNQVLNKIVEAGTALTRAEEGLLLLPDEDGKTLYLRAMKGLDDDNARNFRIRNQNSLVGQVFRTGKPLLVGDSGPQQIRTQYFVKSLLYVPMMYKGQVIGVLGVNNKRVPRVFTLNDQELLLDLAAHAAIAIENARLYEDRLEQNRQLAILAEAGKVVNSTLSMGDVLLGICQQIMHAINLNGCQILQRQPDESLRTIARTWRAIWMKDQGARIKIDSRAMLKKALDQGAFFVVNRTETKDRWEQERDLLVKEGANQLLLLPLKSSGSTQPISLPPVGFIELYYRGTVPEVTSEFRQQLRSLAMEATTLIAQDQRPLPAQLILNGVEQIVAYSGADWICLWLIDGDSAVRVVEYGSTLYFEEPYATTKPPCDCAPTDNRTSTYDVRDAEVPEDTRAVMQSYGARMMLCVPLSIKNELFGVVTAYNTLDFRTLRPEEVKLVQGLVTQAATGIDNARLYSDLQSSIEELKRAQAKLVETARLTAIGELAAVVAHQINNPLTTVIGDAELILRDLPQDSPMREGVTAIHRAGRRSLTVVKRLLSNARREPHDQPQLVDVHESIRNTL
ncbi:MAG: GAF domain-containing protein, partial [Anaerolineae bacterium]